MLRDRYPVLGELDASLAGVVPAEPVTLAGEWSFSQRLTYGSEAQAGSGAGPYDEVHDAFWSGRLACAVPVVCLAFLCTPDLLFWARSSVAAAELPVELWVRGWAERAPRRRSVACRFAGAWLPGMAMASRGAVEEDAAVEAAGHATGRLGRLVRLVEGEILVYMIPAGMIRFGRKRIWHFRTELAEALPSAVAELLTRNRSGRIPPR